MIPELIIVAVLVGFILKGKLDRLADAPIKHIWLLFVVAIAYEGSRYVNRQVGCTLDTPVFTVVRFAGMFGMLAFAYLNRHIVGSKLVMLGMLANTVASITNGGRMPVSKHAVVAVIGQKAANELMKGSYVRHLLVTDYSRLNILGDIIPGKKPLFLIPSIYSIGDVLLTLGVAIAIITLMRAPLPKKEASNES